MAKVNNINLKNYRNFKSLNANFENINIIYGNNGAGKTNILESISLMGKGRGFRNANITNLIYKNEKNFLIQSEIENNLNRHNLRIYSEYFENKHKKILNLDNENTRDTNKFIEKSFSFLFFLPEMERLFLSSPTYRRNFLDKLIFSKNKNYNKLINSYKRNILERGKILNSLNYDLNWIKTIENAIIKNGLEIYNLRNKQISLLNDELGQFNKYNNYPFRIKFEIEDSFYNNTIDEQIYAESLEGARNIDSQIGGSKIGPHKSDLYAIVNDQTNASQLSTGQQKTLILMTLFAQCKYLINQNIKPILLFDEICSHLDDINRKILLDLTKQFDAQFFFTGTEKSLFSFMSTNVNFCNISKL